jgi:CBS-domain-containing membrane protein
VTTLPGQPPPAGDDPVAVEASVRHTLAFAQPAVAGVTLTSLLGTAALLAGIGLIATSAWLISRASQHPPESAVALAIVGVQFCGLSRGVFRYGQQLVGHDVAFHAYTSGSRRWPPPGSRPSAAVTCWPASCTTSTRCRTFWCG